ncbi:hemophore-related protein [Mycobacterium neglectum]|jgi:hemophore-related protein|uniref:hemophore-related protein n=1 Tax=Mycobacterium neglectum TaxID=242737 RepID=UPI000BFEF74E|nr:hemophore-related protein [Mycobacterium neglectum]
MRSIAKVLIASGGLVVSLTAGAGLASAQDLSPIINTTCTYPQVLGALNAQDPAAAAELTSSPMANGVVQDFLASPVPQRQVTAQRLSAVPAAQQYLDTMLLVAGTCNNF